MIQTGLSSFGAIYLRFIDTDINGVYRNLYKSRNPEKKSSYDIKSYYDFALIW